MKFSVDPWDPSYGASLATDIPQSEAVVVIDVEVPAADWSSRRAPATLAAPDTIVFVDGVRRLEARAWIELGDGLAVPGIFASYAAGAVRCNHTAEVVGLQVGRGVYGPADVLVDVETPFGCFAAHRTSDGTPEVLTYALHECMAECEVQVAEQARRAGNELLVLDGPLRTRGHIPDAVGLVKTHHVRYLPPALDRVVATLGAGERTPVFRVDAHPFSRHSWYLRLPGPTGGPWAGIVRCEATGALAADVVAALADVVAIALPRFASEPHKDPRAPQNLYPIGGLERELRHRLGDAGVMYRALRSVSVSVT
ncbi:MAG: DNA double-strand break repair nuclease NurA [Actinomycetota bacterium]